MASRGGKLSIAVWHFDGLTWGIDFDPGTPNRHPTARGDAACAGRNRQRWFAELIWATKERAVLKETLRSLKAVNNPLPV
jgi:hypothetical protein